MAESLPPIPTPDQPESLREASRGTICVCGRAKSYHRPEDNAGHEYEPRYPARRAAPTPEAAGLREALVEAYRALDRAVLLAREPDPAPPSDLRAAHEAWHGPGCSGQCEVMRFIAALPAPTPEAAGLREAVEKFLRRWDDPERYHPIPAVDDLRAALAAPEAAGLRELADEITKDWNGRPDVCPNCGHSSIGCVAPSQADRGLDAATTEYLAWAEADVPPDRTFEDWHDKGTVLLRNLAARLQDSIPDSSSQETE